MTSDITRKNGCVFTECIVPLPCKRKAVPKNRESFCSRMVTETKRSSIPQESGEVSSLWLHKLQRLERQNSKRTC